MKKNCFINGNGIVVSGEYEKVEICGTGVLGNNVLADKIIVNGSASFGENIEADIVEINGVCASVGSIKCKKLFINGKFSGKNIGILCETLNVIGEIKVQEGEIKSKDIKVRGVIFANSLNADFINISPRRRTIISKILKKKKDKSVIKHIEGENIEIDNINVESIDCNRIIVGKNCCVKQLNCKGKPEIIKGATVDSINGNFVFR